MTARRRLPAHLVVPLVAGALASFALIGADSLWLAAVGRYVARGTIPHALPFASAPTAGWHDVPALAELVFHGLEAAFGDRGLIGAQVVAATAAFWTLAVGLRRQGAGSGPIAGVSALVVAGAIPSVVVVRNGLFTLILLPLLLWLLEEEAVRPSRRIWLAVPLLALWSNLHGAALVGLGLLGAYALVERPRALPVAAAGAVALCATPELWHTPAYYVAVAENEAARRGVGLWAPLQANGWDALLVACALVLVVLARRRTAWRRFELLAAAGLALATIRAERLGEALLFLLAYPAARALAGRRTVSMPALLVVVPLAAIVAVNLVRTPLDTGDRPLAAVAAATGEPVLAEQVLAEQVELDGGRVWVANPLDAFRRRDQALYLDWLAGDPRGRAAVERVSLVLVLRSSVAGREAARDPRLHRIGADRRAALYAVRR